MCRGPTSSARPVSSWRRCNEPAARAKVAGDAAGSGDSMESARRAGHDEPRTSVEPLAVSHFLSAGSGDRASGPSQELTDAGDLRLPDRRRLPQPGTGRAVGANQKDAEADPADLRR